MSIHIKSQHRRRSTPCFFLAFLMVVCCPDFVLSEETCGLWIGPSHIKEDAEHGFGLGMYAGKMIPKGTLMSSELLIPVPDFDDTKHPPLREYLWTGGAFMPLTLQSSKNHFLYSPGLASVTPCTGKNFNLEFVLQSETHDLLQFDNAQIHRSKDPTTGSFTYYQTKMFRAIRDIQPGEEFSVECSDEEFDGAEYADMPREFSTKAGFQCLDDKLTQGPRPASQTGIGQGVFAKRDLKGETVILSSPSVPLHMDLLKMESEEHPLTTQLLLNYCFGHPKSDLLWLPFGPYINSINHSSKPNAKVVWHRDPISNDTLERRQQYHHPELLDYPSERVADIHGKGLVMDVVALRDITAGEEILIDYGSPWVDAWTIHTSQYAATAPQLKDSSTYVAAPEFNRLQQDQPLRTITEQHRHPYPHNLLTACRFEQDWIEDEFAEEYDMVQYHSWNSQEEDHTRCLLPCILLERLDEDGAQTYTAKLVDQFHDNEHIEWDCHIFRRFEYIYEDIPRQGIEFVEQKYSSDHFLQIAFRHPITTPDLKWPEHWMKQKVRRRQSSKEKEERKKERKDRDIFKRKSIEPLITREEIERKLEASPRTDL